MNDAAVRDHVRTLLEWGDAHLSYDAAVKGFPPSRRGLVPTGLPHSAWQLVEHLRLAQADILEFCLSPKYKEKKFPDDYWPRTPAPRDATAWTTSIMRFRRDRKAMQRLAADRTVDLLATIPWGTGQTYLREILLAADHGAYHVGQLILVRRALGVRT
jgi:DinB family protein